MIEAPAARLEPDLARPQPRKRSSQGTALYRVTIVLILVVGVARIVSTYGRFSQTVDEPFHIACGMQLLQEGLYNIELQHPPLARIAVALGPYLAGLRAPSQGEGTERGNAILIANNRYWHNLALARLGTLPFFLLGCAVVWFWSNYVSGKVAALFSLLLFSLLPPVLGHSGLATNDVAAMATLCLALYSFVLWMEDPGWWKSAALGLAIGLAVVTKFSAFLFLPGCAAVLLLLFIATGAGRLCRHSLWRFVSELFLCLAFAILVVWAGYGFSLAPLQASRPHAIVDRFFKGQPSIHYSLAALLETPIPGGQLPKSLADLASHNAGGHTAFFLGEWRRRGWWYFFPVIFLVKTPVAFLLFMGIGSVSLAHSFIETGDARKLAPLVCVPVIFGLCIFSHITIGLRHILVVYPLLAIVSGCGASEIFGSPHRRMISRTVIAGAVVWLTVSSVLIHPDYLAYFNVLAGNRPERIEVDSDLDWGQDLARLSKWLKARGVQDIAISYFGTADLNHAGLPSFHELAPNQKVSGWVAISAYNRALPHIFAVKRRSAGIAPYYYIPASVNGLKPDNGPFAWLEAYKPVAKVGNSIFVYNIPPKK